MIPERIARLRREMEARNISVYIVPTADFHESEYVGEHFKARKFITGFTGSAGTAVITPTEAGLWTDGRYFLQAAQQLEGTGVTLYRMGEEGVPTMMEFVRSALGSGGVLGFDGRVINASLGRELESLAKEKDAGLHVSEDLIGLIWDDRPPLSCEKVYILPDEYSGRNAADNGISGRIWEAVLIGLKRPSGKGKDDRDGYEWHLSDATVTEEEIGQSILGAMASDIRVSVTTERVELTVSKSSD